MGLWYWCHMRNCACITISGSEMKEPEFKVGEMIELNGVHCRIDTVVYTEATAKLGINFRLPGTIKGIKLEGTIKEDCHTPSTHQPLE